MLSSMNQQKYKNLEIKHASWQVHRGAYQLHIRVTQDQEIHFWENI